MHRHHESLHIFELVLQAFFTWVDHDLSPLAEKDFLDLDKTEQFGVAHRSREQLVDLSLIVKHDSKQSRLGHGAKE